MGANNSTRRVSYESDENDNITVVKGIRLSENVINRMREPSSPPKQEQVPAKKMPSMAPLIAPSLLRPVPPLFDPITSLPPPPPPLAPIVEPVEPLSPPPAPSFTENVSVTVPPPPPPQPPTEQVAAPTVNDIEVPPSSLPAAANAVLAPAIEPVAAPTAPAIEPVAAPTAPVPAPAPDPAAAEPVILSSPLSPAAPTPPLVPVPCTALSATEANAPLAPPPVAVQSSAPPINQPIATSPPVIEPNDPPLVIEPVLPSHTLEPIPPPLPVEIKPVIAPPLPESEPLPSSSVCESVAILPPAIHPLGDTLSPEPAEPFAAAPLPEFTAPCEPVAPPPQPPIDPVPPAPHHEPVEVPELSSVPSPPPAPVVDEEALKKKITDELHMSMEEDRAKAEQDLQAWLEVEKARSAAKAQADAKSQIQDEVSRILSVERSLSQESLQQAVIRERISTEDEKLRAQLLEIGRKAKQLEAKESDLKKQDAFYREQVARLEDRSAQFYKVTTENYHKAADQVNAKFKRYEMYPVCADLQGQILACYKDNVGKTLNCSSIASLYLQCVNNAKQSQLKTGG